MEILQQIASTLRAIRKGRGWSLDKTARETGVSKAMLGQIERAESSPTISTLWKIASGLNIPFSLFIADGGKGESGATKVLHPSDDKFKVLPLFPFDAKLKCEIFLIELLPGCERYSPPHQAHVIEHVLVVDGEVEVLVDSKWKQIGRGQGLRFDASKPHGYRNLSEASSTLYDVIHYP